MIRRYPARCNVLAQGKLAKRRRAYRAPQCRRIPRPCGKLHLSGNGSMAWGMDRPAWKTFGTDDIERAVGEVSYLRGLDYFVRGMVRSVEFGPAGRIHGEVSGSRPKPYAVAGQIRIRKRRDAASARRALLLPGRLQLQAHGRRAARRPACLAGGGPRRRRDRPRVRLPGRPPMAGRLARGGRGKAGSPAGRSARARPGPPLFYVIHRDATGGMRIDPYRAYLKKDGAIGRNFREYREGTAFAQRKFLTSEDAALPRAGSAISRRASGPDITTGRAARS